MVFFCPICWKEVNENDIRCPYCGADITEHEKRSFEEKLINALKHPERETVQRAVRILGKLKCTKAVEPLGILFEQMDDPFLEVQILDALSEIGTSEAVDVIVKALDSVENIVRRKARELIESRIYR